MKVFLKISKYLPISLGEICILDEKGGDEVSRVLCGDFSIPLRGNFALHLSMFLSG